MAKKGFDLQQLATQSVSVWLNQTRNEPYELTDTFDDLGIDLPALIDMSRYIETQFSHAGVTIDLPPEFVRRFTHGTVHSFITALPGQSTTGSSGPIIPIKK